MSNLSRSAELLRTLIRCPSITPEEGGALGVLQLELERLGFAVHRVFFSDEGMPDVENLYARLGDAVPNICFAGHTDVVPAGESSAWKKDPFSGDVVDGEMIGRGAVDMKGGIACFLAAVESFLKKKGKPEGSISFLITGDEEGPAVNGTEKLLKWASGRGQKFDACIVGEPVNPQAIGDIIRIGRRGSLSGVIIIDGIQGHVAYPHLADNPARGALDLLDSLLAEPFDRGNDHFQATNPEVISIDMNNLAVNVIPPRAKIAFNIRFNNIWNEKTLKREVLGRLEKGSRISRFRKDGDGAVNFYVKWLDRVSPAFLTRDQKLIALLENSIRSITGRIPQFSTGGGTSDARFIKDYCPVVEFGLINQTMHQINERVRLEDLDVLTAVYERFLQDFFNAGKQIP